MFTIISWVNINHSRWQKNDVLDHDVGFYYSYLPAHFYFHDLSLNFIHKPEYKHYYKLFSYPHVTPQRNYVIKSTMGMSITYLPFFITGHYFAKLLGYPMTGYSTPYQIAIQFSSLFWLLVGLIYLYKSLIQFFSEKETGIAIFVFIFGTNVFYYTTIGAGMTHITDFGIASAFIYFCLQWHRSPTFKYALLIGLTIGLLTLIRPINIIFVLFFLLFSHSAKESIQLKLKRFWLHKEKLALIAFMGILVFLPQLLYWKKQTGHYFFNSYIGEPFYFANPEIINGLFSFRKGWLIYTPMLFFALGGFYVLYKNGKSLFYPILLITGIYIYVVFSWWCWWYGGSFGQRALIEIYPFLIFPFCMFISKMHAFQKGAKLISISLILFFLILNLFQSMQAKWNIIHFDSMTKEAYWDAFFRIEENPGREKYLDHPDYEKARLRETD
ncbi:MAG: hypothetical protein IPM51_16735 [Sphingobacteriaceae bacterium]|nr:hypothetical protein [Sphingobacteriaceae bacterium]